MTRFAFLSPPYPGHLNPMLALARGLVAGGHSATFVAQSDVGTLIRDAGMGFKAVGAATHPPGTLDRMTGRLAGTTALFGIRGVIDDVARTTEMLCREGVEALREIGTEAIVADQTESAGGLLARRLGLPQISIANALLINREPLIPPPFIGWRYDASDWGMKRNRGGYRVADLLLRPVNAVIRRFAEAWRLGSLASIEDCLSPHLQISQTVEGLDFPRREAPQSLVHVGPLRDADTQSFEPSDGRPLVFCSLGTLQGSRFKIFEAVARASAALDLSLLIAHGGKLGPDQIDRLTGGPRVEAYVPQRAVMAQAAAVVTHGGLNTILDALAAGVPLIVIPIAFEQGAIASRIERSGAGLTIRLRQATAAHVAAALARLRDDARYRRNALGFRREIEAAGGVRQAVALIEGVVARGAAARAGTSHPR